MSYSSRDESLIGNPLSEWVLTVNHGNLGVLNWFIFFLVIEDDYASWEQVSKGEGLSDAAQ